MKFARLIATALVAYPLVAAAQPISALPRGTSGNFYDPSHSGHGVNIEVIDESRAIVYWSVYDHSGNPMTLYVEGRIEGNKVFGPAYAPRGMRFGEFDRARLQAPYWGDIELTFQSCARATMKYSSAFDFGSGEIPLQRLALTYECRGGHLLPSGTLSGQINYGYAAAGRVDGVVMPDSTLYATVPTVREPDGYGFRIDTTTRVLIGPQASGTPGRVVSQALLMPNAFLCAMTEHGCDDAAASGISLEFLATDQGMTATVPSDGAMVRISVGGNLPSSEQLRGTFEFDVDGRKPGRYQMVIDQDGSLCVRMYPATKCLFAGKLQHAPFEPPAFELRRPEGGPAWRGIVLTDFTQVFAGPYRLRFIGSNGFAGLALTARYDWRQ